MALDTQQLIEAAKAHAAAAAGPTDDPTAFGQWLGLGLPITEQKAVVAETLGGKIDPETGEAVFTSDWLRQQLQNMNIDVSDQRVVNALTAQEWWTQFEVDFLMRSWANDPSLQLQGPTTTYSNAFAASGFTGEEFAIPATPATRLLTEQGIAPGAVGPKGPISQPETGWEIYSSEVLVDRENGGVYYKPNSTAPGSPWWRDDIQQTWSEEQVSSWRNRLVDMGYLPKGAEKTDGFDAAFLSALEEYHRNRYLNHGKPIALDAAAAKGVSPVLTPRDFLEATRNNVRQQFMAVFGSEPTDAELQSWTQFTVKTAVQLQRKYMRKGLEETTALSAARTEAGEATANRLWEDPLAVEMRGNFEENTKLADALQRAASVTQGLIG